MEIGQHNEVGPPEGFVFQIVRHKGTNDKSKQHIHWSRLRFWAELQETKLLSAFSACINIDL